MLKLAGCAVSALLAVGLVVNGLMMSTTASAAPQDVTLVATARGHTLDLVFTNNHFNKVGCAVWAYFDNEVPRPNRSGSEQVAGFNPIEPGRTLVTGLDNIEDGRYRLYWECAGLLDEVTPEGTNSDGYHWGTSPFLAANDATSLPVEFAIPGPDGPAPTQPPVPTTTSAPSTTSSPPPQSCFGSACLPAVG